MQVGLFFFHKQMVHHKKGEHSPHAVEAEAFPHFGKKEVPELLWILALEGLDVGKCCHVFFKSLCLNGIRQKSVGFDDAQNQNIPLKKFVNNWIANFNKFPDI